MDKILFPNNYDEIEELNTINTVKDFIMLKYNMWNYNEPFVITIETDNYSSNFTIDSNSCITSINGVDLEDKLYFSDIKYSFEEIINDVDFTTQLDADATEGSKEIVVKDNEFLVNDIIKIKDELYKIIDMNENTLKLDHGLVESDSEGNDVILQGNTGIYKLIISDKIEAKPNSTLEISLIFISKNTENDKEETINKIVNCLYSNRYVNTIIQAVI